MKHAIESVQFIKSDGTVYELNSPPTRAVWDMTGWGKPDETIYATTGLFQHGQSWVSYRLNPRKISLQLAHRYCSRSEWHSGRSALLAQMGLNNSSPNSPESGVLRWSYLEDDTYKTRDLDVRLSRGLGFTPLSGYRQWSVLEGMEFIADNPLVYDPDEKSRYIASWTDSLMFSMTFPFILGSRYGTTNITYLGTWESYPTIVISGPASGVYIENQSTGKIIRFDYTVSLGELVTIDLSYGSKTVTNNLGQNLMEFISEDSNLGEFTIQPDPIVAGGVNSMLIVSTNTINTTSYVGFLYYRRYYGI